jgi:hypothetical protein
MIVYLGRRMGIQTSELESMLQPHLRDITGGYSAEWRQVSFWRKYCVSQIRVCRRSRAGGSAASRRVPR